MLLKCFRQDSVCDLATSQTIIGRRKLPSCNVIYIYGTGKTIVLSIFKKITDLGIKRNVGLQIVGL